MDALAILLDRLKKEPKVQGYFLGLIHILIGRRLTTTDGKLVSSGLSWRDVAAMLKKIRWDPEAVRELGIAPKTLPPRDRYRYWYQAITQARVDSPPAITAGDRCAEFLQTLGYNVGPPPGR